MLGNQVMNQSTENGNIPLGGEQPRISRYRRDRRSWLRRVSASRTCRRAPSEIIALARRMSSASCATLLMDMAADGSGELLDRLLGQQNRGMGLLQRPAQHVLGQRRQQAVVVEPEAAQQRARTGQLDQLGGRQT